MELTKNADFATDEVRPNPSGSAVGRTRSLHFDQRTVVEASGVELNDNQPNQIKFSTVEGNFKLADIYPITLSPGVSASLKCTTSDFNSLGEVFIMAGNDKVFSHTPSRYSDRASNPLNTTTSAFSYSGDALLYVTLKGRSSSDYRIHLGLTPALAAGTASYQYNRTGGQGVQLQGEQKTPAVTAYETPRGRSTKELLAVGNSFFGAINPQGDRDWIKIKLTGGNEYQFDLERITGGVDVFLRLYDGGGNLVASNDDGGAGYDARITFTPTVSSDFYLEAALYNDLETGTYKLTATATGATSSPAPAPSPTPAPAPTPTPAPTPAPSPAPAETGPKAISGYYPLYDYEANANAAGNGTSHAHTFNGVTYYMPNGVTFYHGNYGQSGGGGGYGY